jgi:hypothetical protein
MLSLPNRKRRCNKCPNPPIQAESTIRLLLVKRLRNRSRNDWILENLDLPRKLPHQYEFCAPQSHLYRAEVHRDTDRAFRPDVPLPDLWVTSAWGALPRVGSEILNYSFS